MKTLETLEVGDVVYHDGDSSFCHLSKITVTDIEYKYDPDTGEKYKIICCSKLKFDGRTGHALNEPLAYYIKPDESQTEQPLITEKELDFLFDSEIKLSKEEYIKILEEENEALRGHLHESLVLCRKVYMIENTFSSELISYYFYDFILNSDSIKKAMDKFAKDYKLR